MKKVVICIVIFKKKIDEIAFLSVSFPDSVLKSFQICVYDNSPEYNIGIEPPQGILYYPQEKNEGIATCYNSSYVLAKHIGAPYLLLLDQDTNVDALFFEHILVSIVECYDIVLPKVFHENTPVSPLEHGIFCKKEVRNQPSINNQRLLFINSGVLFSIDFLDKIGGFNPIFWLDMQDYWLSLMAFRSRANVKVLDCTINHNLSVLNEEYISIERYKNIHYYTAVFSFQYENISRKLMYIIFLILRYAKRFNYLRKNKYLLGYWKIFLCREIYG